MSHGKPPVENATVLQIKMCKCGRAPHRPKQRNCHFCNADAQKAYRKQMREAAKRFREIQSIAGKQ